jgi:NAD+ synthase (glutamine-hydrolysing)
MRIFMAQTNPTIGDLAANTDRILEFSRKAASQNADLVVFPELSISGYPPRDLLDRQTYLSGCEAQLLRIVEESKQISCGIIVGYPRRRTESFGKPVANTAVLIENGHLAASRDKILLPTYDVFDDYRHFEAGTEQAPIMFRGKKLGLVICEDAWNDKQFWPHPLYKRDPVAELMGNDIDLLITINASPYHFEKRKLRQEMVQSMAKRHGRPIIFVAQAGGQDHILFDGSSFAVDAQGKTLAVAQSFTEDLVAVDLETGIGEVKTSHPRELDAAYDALVMGTRDYFTKCGFGKALIGLSGGIDSSLVACIAVDAVGRENVIGVGMPGPYSSDHSVKDARAMAEALGIRFELISIKSPYEAMLQNLDPVFAGFARDVTEENLQARLRGMTLMAMSNKFRALVLTTGNKSELAVGYCTLYGDMCGGLALISDVPKLMVYQLCRVANERHQNAIPENVFVKPPSAELRPDQKDSDSLPEYDVLDPLLEAYIEDNKPITQIAEEQRLPIELVREIARKVNLNEYKRQQAAPGLRITSKGFGFGRRYPIAQRFKE